MVQSNLILKILNYNCQSVSIYYKLLLLKATSSLCLTFLMFCKYMYFLKYFWFHTSYAITLDDMCVYNCITVSLLKLLH